MLVSLVSDWLVILQQKVKYRNDKICVSFEFASLIVRVCCLLFVLEERLKHVFLK